MNPEDQKTFALFKTIDENFNKEEVISITVGLLETHFNNDYKLIIDKVQQFRDYYDSKGEVE